MNIYPSPTHINLKTKDRPMREIEVERNEMSKEEFEDLIRLSFGNSPDDLNKAHPFDVFHALQGNGYKIVKK